MRIFSRLFLFLLLLAGITGTQMGGCGGGGGGGGDDEGFNCTEDCE